jgi:hypothetical protein
LVSISARFGPLRPSLVSMSDSPQTTLGTLARRNSAAGV